MEGARGPHFGNYRSHVHIAEDDALSQIHRLVNDAKSMGVPLTEHDASRLQLLLDELERWNRTYNLTAITKREDMVTHHLLDSLAIHTELHGTTIADVGTGAGFPGLPLAVVNPERRFTLIDSAGKKIRFVSHAAHALGLTNVEAVHGRVESLRPDEPFDTIMARAFAPLPKMLETVTPLCGPQSRVLAMKGKWPQDEVDAISPEWRVERSRNVVVPGLAEARCTIILVR
ncbi:MAG: rRNA (guanine527-N7)-methyltransferase [Gammaproteobacteria bacterium]|nr:rRNA (guanine527-N7)-methyltransferase [Gammaproteobacteria bacterium]